MGSRAGLFLVVCIGCGSVTAPTHDAPLYTLTVVQGGTGAGMGSITSPAGIDCGTTCTVRVPAGPVTLTAASTTNAKFRAWDAPACTDASQPCTIMISADTTVTATFAKFPFACADMMNPTNQVAVEPGQVVLGVDAQHAASCTDVAPGTIRIAATGTDPLRFAPVGVFAGRGPLDSTVRDRPENVLRICNHLGYMYGHGLSTIADTTNMETIIDAGFTTFTASMAGDDWNMIECDTVSPGKACTDINDANGYNVIIAPGKVILGADATHAVRCTQVDPNHIHIFETSNFDTLRFAPLGLWATNGTYNQSVRNIPENIERMCNYLGYPVAAGTTTTVNSSIEALVAADMQSYTVPVAGDDWLTFDCTTQ